MPATHLILGCGYLGQRVAALWRQRGERVHATTRRIEPLRGLHEDARGPDRAEVLRAQGLEPVVCDVLDPASLRALPAVDTVVHAVALDRGSGASMRAVYVDGLANVLAHLPPPRRFLYVSSSGVYGQSDGGWVDETAATEPHEESGRIVLDAERVLRQHLPEAVILRFSGIYGPGRLLRRQAIEAGAPLVIDPEKWLNLIHVEDGAGAVLAAAERAQPGCLYNVCDDNPVRRRDFYTEMARLLAAPPPQFVPPPADQPPPPHEKGNRRIANRRMKDELGVALRYPDYRCGLAASV